MKCPDCKVVFHPQMDRMLIGKNARNTSVHVFYQICPECKEPIVGVREQRPDEWSVSSSDVEGLTLLSKQKS